MVNLVPPIQMKLFQVEKQIEHDGVEMGVLENGIPYLTESGLVQSVTITLPVFAKKAVA